MFSGDFRRFSQLLWLFGMVFLSDATREVFLGVMLAAQLTTCSRSRGRSLQGDRSPAESTRCQLAEGREQRGENRKTGISGKKL